MTEIAAALGVVVALVALWLASQAYNEVNNTFKDFTDRVAKEVQNAKSEFSRSTENLMRQINKLERDLSSVDQQSKVTMKHLQAAIENQKKIEHELDDLIESLPANLRRNARPKAPPPPEFDED